MRERMRKKKKYIYNYEKYTEGKGGRLKMRRAEMEKEARTGGLHTHARAGWMLIFTRPGMIKGRVAFYARSFHFRAPPGSRMYLEQRARAINRGTRPVISARLCRAPPLRNTKKPERSPSRGHVLFRPSSSSDITPTEFLRNPKFPTTTNLSRLRMKMSTFLWWSNRRYI